MKYYKLTDAAGKTRADYDNECQWGENITHEAEGKGIRLCSPDFIHAYRDPYQAILLNPINGNYDENTMLMWEGEGEEIVYQEGKSGFKRFTTEHQIPIPDLPLELRVEIAIHLALQVYEAKDFRRWAEDWLDGKDRTVITTEIAAEAAGCAAWWAAEAAGWAVEAAEEAGWAARAAKIYDGDIILETIYAVLENQEKENARS